MEGRIGWFRAQVEVHPGSLPSRSARYPQELRVDSVKIARVPLHRSAPVSSTARRLGLVPGTLEWWIEEEELCGPPGPCRSGRAWRCRARDHGIPWSGLSAGRDSRPRCRATDTRRISRATGSSSPTSGRLPARRRARCAGGRPASPGGAPVVLGAGGVRSHARLSSTDRTPSLLEMRPNRLLQPHHGVDRDIGDLGPPLLVAPAT